MIPRLPGPFRGPFPLLFARRWAHLRRPAPAAGPELVLDLSRLLARAYHPTPTGVDRVEMAWATGLDRRFPGRLRYAALHPAGGYWGRLPPDAARDFLRWTAERWEEGRADRAGAVRRLWALRPRPVPPAAGPRLLLKASPQGLEDGRLAQAVLRMESARLLCLVHDLIPLTHPEYARPGGRDLAARRLATVDALADGVLANSRATLAELTPRLLPRPGRLLAAAPLGVDPRAAASSAEAEPYFVCVGTVEPRKNHLFLLHLWRRLAETLPPRDVPRLVLAGRRGWENENALDLLERSDAIRPHVREAGPLGDRELAALLAGARALLFPSFAEGFGLPVAEALAAGVPVLCSDLPALREAGGPVPEYLDPLDGPAWAAAVLDYARSGSPRRAAQLARLAGWHAPSWDDHLDRVAAAAESLLTARRASRPSRTTC